MKSKFTAPKSLSLWEQPDPSNWHKQSYKKIILMDYSSYSTVTFSASSPSKN